MSHLVGQIAVVCPTAQILLVMLIVSHRSAIELCRPILRRQSCVPEGRLLLPALF